MALHQRTLLVLDGDFAICRPPDDASIPSRAIAGESFSITRTPDELSIVCPQAAVPEGIQCVRGWRCLRVAGTMPFSVLLNKKGFRHHRKPLRSIPDRI